MKRYLSAAVEADLDKKIVLLTGPRQAGKTTLGKNLSDSYDYLNYDSKEDRLILQKKNWDRQKSLIIFDELHKKKEWKRWLKGIYDTEGIPPRLLVTSAQLDTYRKVGDSLAGRYFQHRLHPIDLKEALQHISENPDTLLETLMHCGGFPEPFLKADPVYYKRWRRSHLDIILKQDLIDLYAINDIKSIEVLVLLLKERVGSSVSYANLARDLEKDINTIKRWLQLLENLYVIFRVTPYHRNIARSLLKEPKFYFYDYAALEAGSGAQLENIVASALLKELHYLTDTQGIDTNLYYLRTKDGQEIDFLIAQNNEPTHMIEVKSADDTPSNHFNHFRKNLSNAQMIQLVKTLKRESSYQNGLEIRTLAPWLANLNLSVEKK